MARLDAEEGTSLPNRRLLAGLAAGCALWAAASGVSADPPSDAPQQLHPFGHAQAPSPPSAAGAAKPGRAMAAPAAQPLRRFYGPPRPPPPPRFQLPMQAVAIQARPPAPPPVQPNPVPSGAAPPDAAKGQAKDAGKDADLPPI